MNKMNYDNLYNMMLSTIPKGTKLLLHCCCAPCSTACLERLGEHFDITLYYYNPCIMPESEYTKRANELIKLTDLINNNKTVIQHIQPIKLVIEAYDNKPYLSKILGHELDPEGGERCSICFADRFNKSHDFALTNHFPYFCSTLTVSPHKNSETINTIGMSIGTDEAKWLPTDFKKNNGYLRSIELSRMYNLYRQDFCGCAYSHYDR